jgi:hypothetical protein
VVDADRLATTRKRMKAMRAIGSLKTRPPIARGTIV